MRQAVLGVFGRQLAGAPLFLALAFLLSLVGPNLISSVADRCLFTWPACLYVAFLVTVRVCRQAEHREATGRTRWASRLTVVAFLLAGYGYFAMCRFVGMSIGWAFLFGLLPSFPFAVLAVRAEERGRSWHTAAWTVLGLAALFAGGFGLLAWKAAQVESSVRYNPCHTARS
jgi:hypothetical protein